MTLLQKKPRVVALVFGHIHRFFEWYKTSFRPTFPQKQLFLLLIVDCEGNPIVFYQTLKVPGLTSITNGFAKDSFHRSNLATDKQNQSGRFVYLDHLPRKP